VVLNLTSRQFVFESGKAVLLADGANDLAHAVSGSLSANRIDAPDLRNAGAYRLVLSELALQRTTDGLRASVPLFVHPHAVVLTEEDIRRGAIAVLPEPEDIFRVTVIDREQEPIPNRRVHMLANLLGFDLNTLFSIEITSGPSGSFAVLGNPCALGIDLDRNTGLLIVPL